jgi:outer membrane protein OmpU
MKKILLGSTALVAAGMIAGGAAKAEDQPIAVSVGGYYLSAFAIMDQDNEGDSAGTSTRNEFANNTNTTAFGQDVEINVGGSATFDNGLTAGFKFVIEGNASGDGSESADERFVFFRGNWGQIRVGSTESARQEFTNFAPGGSGIFGVNTPFFIFANPGNAQGIFNVRTYDDGLGNEDSTKIVYFSPSFNGFSFALSYAPSDARQSQYGGNTRDVSGQLLDQVSGAVAFDKDFGGFKMRLAAGYESYNLDRCGSTVASQNCEDSPASWHAGGTFTIGKVSFGGGYLNGDLVSNATSTASRDREDFDIGIAYWDAMWGVGLQYGRAEQEGTDRRDEIFDVVALNGTYILGPGVSLQAQVDVGAFDDDTVSTSPNDNEFFQFMVGSSLSF